MQAESGSLGARGEASRPPVQAGGRIAEWAAGAYGAAAGLAAVLHAARTGEGVHIDVSLTEVMCICTTLFTDLMMSLMGRPPLPQPPRVVEFPSIEPTKDGWVGFNTNAAQMFNDFLVLIGRDDLIGQAMVRMDPARRDEFEKSTQAWTLEHTTAEVIEEASMFRIPVAPVGNGENLPTHEHLVARQLYTTSPSGGFTQPRPPYRLSGRRLGTSSPAPALGEHTGRIEPRRRAATRRDPIGPAADGRPQGARHDVVVGRPGGDGVVRRPGGRRHPRRIHPGDRRHAPGRGGLLLQPRPVVGAQQFLSRHQSQQTRHHAEPLRSERPPGRQGPRRAGPISSSRTSRPG